MENAGDTAAQGAGPGQISIEARISDLVRLGIIGLFAYWTLVLVAPFALIVVWSAILAVALFPIFEALSRLIGNRPVIAAVVIVVFSLVLIIAPLALVAVNFADAAQALIGTLREGNFTLPAAPAAIREWPVVGERIHGAWNQIASDLAATIIKFQAPIREVTAVIVAKLASIGVGVLSFVVSIVLSGIFLTRSAPWLQPYRYWQAGSPVKKVSALPGWRAPRCETYRAASSASPFCRRCYADCVLPFLTFRPAGL